MRKQIALIFKITLYRWAFILSTILLCFWYIDSWENSNTCSRVLPVASYLDLGNFVLNNYKDKTIDISVINGNYYTDKAPLPTLITLPFAWLFKSIGVLQKIDGSYYGKSLYLIGAILCGVLPFLLILYVSVNKYFISGEYVKVMLGITAFLASFIFVFAGTFFAHVLAACFILIAYINFKDNKFALTGFLCGLAFLTEYTTLWITVAWMFILFFRSFSIKQTAQFALGFSPAAVFILGYNYYFTGNAFTMLYLFVADNFNVALKSVYGLSYPKLQALFGLLFSQNRGLFFYAPIVIYGLFLLVKTQKIFTSKNLLNLSVHPVVLPFVFTLLFISSHAAWDGGYSYGPRHLTAVTVLLIYALVQHPKFGEFKPLLYPVLLYGIACAFLAKLTVLYSIPELDQNVLTYLWTKLNDPLNDGNILSLLFHCNAMTGFVVFAIVFLIWFLSGYLLAKEKVETA